MILPRMYEVDNVVRKSIFEYWKLEMRIILILLSYIFCQSTCYAVELPVDLSGKDIPKDYLVTNWISADLNADGQNDYFIVLEKRVAMNGVRNAHDRERLALIFTRQTDGSYKELERNGIFVSCVTCAYDYAIEKFSSPTQITSWVPDQNTGALLPAYIPTEITSFAEKGYRIIAWVSADLNGDQLNDYLVVVERNDAYTCSDEGLVRSTIILERLPNQSLKLAKRNNIVASSLACIYSYTSEAFVQISVSKRTFSIRREYLGTAFLDIFTYTFGYSRRDNTWQLIRAEGKYDALTSGEVSTVNIYTPPKDFGKIDFADFDPESYLARGLGYVWEKSKKSQIAGTPDWFKVGALGDANDDKHEVDYADRSTIKVKGNMATMLTLFDFKGERGSDDYKYASATAHQEYDCKNKRYRILYVNLYSEGMGKGRKVDSFSPKDQWSPVSQDESLSELFWKLACGL